VEGLEFRETEYFQNIYSIATSSPECLESVTITFGTRNHFISTKIHEAFSRLLFATHGFEKQIILYAVSFLVLRHIGDGYSITWRFVGVGFIFNNP